MRESAEKRLMVRVKKYDGKYDYVRRDMVDYYISIGYLHPDSRSLCEREAHEHVKQAK